MTPNSPNPLNPSEPNTAPPPAPAPRRSWPLWVLAALLVVLTALVQHRPDRGEPQGDKAPALDEVELMGRAYARLGHMMRGLDPKAPLTPFVEQMDAFARDSKRPIDALRAAVFAGEFLGPEAALERLSKLPAPAPPAGHVDHAALAAAGVCPYAMQGPAGLRDAVRPGDDRALGLAPLLRRVYEQGPGTLDEAERARLSSGLPFFGDLALARGDAEKTRAILRGGPAVLAVMVLAVVLVGGALLAGVGLLITFLVLLLMGRLRPAPPSPAAASLPPGLLAEIFVLFLLGFLAIGGLSMALGALFPGENRPVWLAPALLLANWLLALTPLWALRRGSTRAQLASALGLTRGRGLAREGVLGLGVYLAALPVFVLAALLALLLHGLFFGRETPPDNPVLRRVIEGGTADLVIFFFMACLWAPLVEEMIFRGALLGAVRGKAGRVLGAGGGAALGVLLSALVFGIIHPVPWLLTMPLMVLGAAFALVRVWRGTLAGAMLAHGVHNFCVLALLTVMLRALGA